MKNLRLAVKAAAVTSVAALALTACGGSNFNESSSSSGSGSELAKTSEPITVMIGSSGEAETASVKKAVAEWSKTSGVKASVVVASDLKQQVSQGLAAGKPADLFYVSTDELASYQKSKALEPYGDKLSNKDDFYPALKTAFTVDDQFVCAPKDFSTLSLVLNEDKWKAAGLTDADIPTDWASLEKAAEKLTSGKTVGLSTSSEVQRLGVFMGQAGGGLVKDGKATANSAESVEGLKEVQKMLKAGYFKYSKDLGAGWGGEAFGKGLAAMTIEGNWVTGALTKDFPDVKYKVVELPAGKQKATLQYTNCWGMAADGKNKGQALSLVEHLTSKDQQLAFAKEFGPMPSVKSAAEDWKKQNPTLEAFLNGAEYAQNLPAQEGSADVIGELNSKLEGLKSGDPQTILDATQKDLEAALESGK